MPRSLRLLVPLTLLLTALPAAAASPSLAGVSSVESLGASPPQVLTDSVAPFGGSGEAASHGGQGVSGGTSALAGVLALAGIILVARQQRAPAYARSPRRVTSARGATRSRGRADRYT